MHAVLVRSPVAHARIRSDDLSRAAAARGVAFALNGAALLELLRPGSAGVVPSAGKHAGDHSGS
jgi:CO/xanthine dehydrogenase Mo-binding subunit